MKHLAIFVGDYIAKILTGEKTMESRFSAEKTLPYGAVKKGDEIYLKESGGLVVGRAVVDNVLYYENLNPEAIGKIRKEYNNELCADDEFWQEKAQAKYATLIFITKAEKFLAPLRIYKRDRRSWVLLDQEKKFQSKN